MIKALQNNKRTRATVILGAILVIALVITTMYQALANYTVTGTTSNVITAGNIDIIINNKIEHDKDFPELGIGGILPGQTRENTVSISNVGEHDAFIRVKVSKLFISVDDTELDIEKAKLNINEDDWTLQDDYYYYNHVLKAGETSEPLYESIKFSSALNNEVKDALFTVDIKAEAVQTQNNGIEPFDAEGWEVAQ